MPTRTMTHTITTDNAITIGQQSLAKKKGEDKPKPKPANKDK